MTTTRYRALGWIAPIHKRFRNQKLDLFFEIAGNNPGGRLLDIGGWIGVAGEFLRLHSSFPEVSVVNLERPNVSGATQKNLWIILADGCYLPFRSRAYDWVFSNAVIEHVGDWQRQKLFADEIRRVSAKGYFVATPNRYFPIEPHTLLPFYQFLPVEIQRRVVRFAPGYLTRYEQIELLSKRQLRLLFPEAKIVDVGFPLIGNSLVAFHKRA